MSITRQEASRRLRARLDRARLHATGSQLQYRDIEEVQFALALLDEIRSYGPHARLRINANGSANFNIYDPTKAAR